MLRIEYMMLYLALSLDLCPIQECSPLYMDFLPLVLFVMVTKFFTMYIFTVSCGLVAYAQMPFSILLNLNLISSHISWSPELGMKGNYVCNLYFTLSALCWIQKLHQHSTSCMSSSLPYYWVYSSVSTISLTRPYMGCIPCYAITAKGQCQPI